MKLFFTFFLLLLYQVLFAQQPDYLLKENNIWTFGRGMAGVPGGIGLDFNSGSPIATATYACTGMWGEAQASVSDSNGNLLFYTDGSSILDAIGNIMPHGDNLVGDPAFYGEDVTTSTTQGAVVVPIPNTLNRYYVFSLTDGENYGNVSHGYGGELFYSVVDMTLNNGLGDIVATQKGIFLDSNLSESMVAVAGTHCDIWILVHAVNDHAVISFNVSLSGINPVPVISHCGYYSNYSYGGAIKVAPSRKKIVVCTASPTEGGAEVCDFDQATGVVSNAKKLYAFGGAYQACFSPDNSKIYIENGGNSILIQFDSSGSNLIEIPHAIYFSDLQLGRDSKIYFHSGGLIDSIGCIESPNLTYPACNFTKNVIAPAAGTSYIGLHNLYVKPLPPDTAYFSHQDMSLCSPPYDSLMLYAPPGFSDYLWSTGSTDSAIGAINTGVFISRSVKYCAAQFDTFRVKKVDVAFTLGPDTNYCSLTPVTLDVPIANANYLWQDGTTDSTYTVTQSGVYSVQVSELGCLYADTVNIGLINVHQNLGNDTIICDNNEQKIQMPLNANVPLGASVMWSNGSADSMIIADTGTYWVNVTDAGCQGSDTITIQSQVCDCVLSMPNAFTPNGDGKNDVFRPIFEPDCPISEYALFIYNRWGQIVFDSVNPSQGWNGTFNSMPSEMGTYMYKLQYTAGTRGQLQYQKGDVTLVR